MKKNIQFPVSLPFNTACKGLGFAKEVKLFENFINFLNFRFKFLIFSKMDRKMHREVIKILCLIYLESAQYQKCAKTSLNHNKKQSELSKNIKNMNLHYETLKIFPNQLKIMFWLTKSFLYDFFYPALANLSLDFYFHFPNYFYCAT